MTDFSRRRFLELLVVAAPAVALDPDRLLWTPGQKLVELADIQDIADEALHCLNAAYFAAPPVTMYQAMARVKGRNSRRAMRCMYRQRPWLGVTPTRPVLDTTTAGRLGKDIAGSPAKHQAHVSLPSWRGYTRMEASLRYLQPAMTVLATQQLRWHGVSAMGTLELPSDPSIEGAIATDPTTGLALRALRGSYLDTYAGVVRETLRVDVLWR